MPYPLGHGGSMHLLAFERVVGYYIYLYNMNEMMMFYTHLCTLFWLNFISYFAL